MLDSSELLVEEYKALRAEIAQSIVKQHWIAAGGYVLAGTIVAAIIQDLSKNAVGLLLIPVVFFSAASLWLVECNRMVRASYYIAYVLWPTLCALTDTHHQGWEYWIRGETKHAKLFRFNQDIFQRLKIVICPAILSGFAIVTLSAHSNLSSTQLWIVGIVTTVGFIALMFVSGFVSNLAAIRDAASHVPGRNAENRPADGSASD